MCRESVPDVPIIPFPKCRASVPEVPMPPFLGRRNRLTYAQVTPALPSSGSSLKPGFRHIGNGGLPTPSTSAAAVSDVLPPDKAVKGGLIISRRALPIVGDPGVKLRLQRM